MCIFSFLIRTDRFSVPAWRVRRSAQRELGVRSWRCPAAGCDGASRVAARQATGIEYVYKDDNKANEIIVEPKRVVESVRDFVAGMGASSQANVDVAVRLLKNGEGAAPRPVDARSAWYDTVAVLSHWQWI